MGFVYKCEECSTFNFLESAVNKYDKYRCENCSCEEWLDRDYQFKSIDFQTFKNKYLKASSNFNKIELKYGKILGLEGKMNFKDIHKTYLNKIKEYHPDKVENLGEELKNLAEKKTKEINEAYEYFKKKYS